MARPSLSSEQIEDFRLRAAEVALQLFVEHGYQRFSLRLLARELGCSHTTPYRYFKDKADIFAAVRVSGFQSFTRFLQQRLSTSRDAEERLRILACAYFDFALQQSDAFRVIFELGQPEVNAYPLVDEAGFSSWSELRGVVREAIEAKVIEGDADLLAHVMWAGIHGVASLQLAGKLTVGRSAEEVSGAMMSALIDAHRPGVCSSASIPSVESSRSSQPPASATRPLMPEKEES